MVNTYSVSNYSRTILLMVKVADPFTMSFRLLSNSDKLLASLILSLTKYIKSILQLFSETSFTLGLAASKLTRLGLRIKLLCEIPDNSLFFGILNLSSCSSLIPSIFSFVSASNFAVRSSFCSGSLSRNFFYQSRRILETHSPRQSICFGAVAVLPDGC
jgi:hypothetical protein